MQIDPKQTRLLYLSGTAALPGPFPSLGVISIEQHCLQFPPDNRSETQSFVVVQQVHSPQRRVTHLIRSDRVAAIFFPATTKAGADSKAEVRAECRDIDSAEGHWFLTPDIDTGVIAEKLGISPDELASRASTARGVVFIPEQEPLLSQVEIGQTAGEAADSVLTTQPVMYCSSSN